MTTFIKLTNTSREQFWINPAMIVSIRRVLRETIIITVGTDYVKVDFADPEYRCLETPEEIMALIAKEQAK